MDEDLREVQKCLDEANRIEALRIEVEAVKTKLQRRVNCAGPSLVRAQGETHRQTDKAEGRKKAERTGWKGRGGMRSLLDVGRWRGFAGSCAGVCGHTVEAKH